MRNRILSLLLTAAIILTTAACGGKPVEAAASVPAEETVASSQPISSAEPEPEEPIVYEYEQAEPLDYHTILEELNEQRKTDLATPASFDGFEEYLVNDPRTANLLTAEEVALITDTSGKEANIITYEQAAQDIDILFRALHYGYGPYYFFGEETFDNAQAELMQWIKEQGAVIVWDFREKLAEVFEFMHDGHAHVAIEEHLVPTRNYTTFLCDGEHYNEDDIGYYKVANGQKWYYDSCDDQNVTMRRVLTDDGEIVYSPVLYCLESEVKDSIITLRDESGNTRTETLVWEHIKNYSTHKGIDYRAFEEAGVSYISLRSLNPTKYPEEYAQFPQSALIAKDSKLLILDLRGNGGGVSKAVDTWIKNFVGQKPMAKVITALRRTNFYDGVPLNKTSVYELVVFNETGIFLNNDTPVILLVDEGVGSSGETTLNLMRTIEDVLVVGSNTLGCKMGGNSSFFRLPNSKIDFRFGQILSFFHEIENIDDKGYLPDIWCDPSMALKSALKLAVNEGYLDEESAAVIFDKSGDGKLSTGSKQGGYIYLESFDKSRIEPGEDIHEAGAPYLLNVWSGSGRRTNYEVYIEDSDVLSYEIKENGSLYLMPNGKGTTVVTILYDSLVSDFLWINE